MMKYMRYLLGFILLCTEGMAADAAVSAAAAAIAAPVHAPTRFVMDIRGTTEHFSFRSLMHDDVPTIVGLVDQCEFKEGLPQNTQDKPEAIRSWAQNLANRQAGGNLFSGLMLESPVGKGFLCFGRMTTADYDPKFTDIIDTYIGFGITRFINPDAVDKYAKSNVARVNNNGLGFLLPVLPQSLGKDKIINALRIAVDAFQYLKDHQQTLPIETTTPTHLIGLFHPTDPLIPALEAAGFKIIRKDGFFGYYDKPRVMAHMQLR